MAGFQGIDYGLKAISYLTPRKVCFFVCVFFLFCFFFLSYDANYIVVIANCGG